ncbi:deoxyribodipyrimidine photo-lyase-like [Teratosphaeria destructans]|uniref:Deoxyribodipyrimidine photo-lyase-like n=1 Tax=Teratosphaeria destructans TaxID=418781 RepID=A0A9W7SN73_9PEZI|nr:deoxyribodipyrimidine photo-lyase-like [Teratosphaeria destructans]
MSNQKKHARSDSQTHDDYVQVENALKHPSTKRAKQVDANTPFDQLCDLVDETKAKDIQARNVLHWFRSKDIRQEDNKSLHAAAQKAKEGSGALITMYLYSPKDIEWHGTSPARSDFILESLRMLKSQLENKKIPLAIVTAGERNEKTQKVMDFVRQHNISHVYANMEYEVDELRRDISIAHHIQKDEDIAFDLLHDQTVLIPGTVCTGSGGPMKVFTPYHRAWLSDTKSDPSVLHTVPAPEGNAEDAATKLKGIIDSKIPDLPESKRFASKEEQERIRKLWPPGNAAGMERLADFLHKKVSDYATHRSEPAKDPSSRLSAYLSPGIVSVREVLAKTKEANGGKHFDAGDAGIDSWVREIVFREFYRQVTVITPHTNMNLPQNLKFDNVEWREDEEGWKRWCEGTTGVPFIDAGMRQLNTEAYMHNRLRMNTSSYLRANYLIDYRKGERYFAEHLIDWDLSNNTQGWEPSYTFFNPVTQAEKCDNHGDFIRKWVPELKDLKGGKGGAIFAPHERLSKQEFEKLGYPRPLVDFAQSASRAKDVYKRDLANADP